MGKKFPHETSQMNQTTFTAPWGLYVPPIFRMMKREFVDRFFRTGELRLSSFAQFAKHANEHRKDNEGDNVCFGKGEHSTLVVVNSVGADAYVLCGTAALSFQLFEQFDCESAIQIYDTTRFASTISSHIPGFVQGFEGLCIYHNKWLDAPMQDIDPEQYKTTKGEMDLTKIDLLQRQVFGVAPFFRKTPKFAYQLEYRMIWIVDHDVDDNLTIHVPRARETCRPFYREDLAALEASELSEAE